MRYTREQFNELVRRKPGLLPVGANSPVKRERREEPTLVKHPQRKPADSQRVLVRCSIIVCRNRLADADNVVSGGTKALRDAIARWLAIDDGDARIRFEYGQLHTSGDEGCIVKLERIEP